RFGRGVVTWGIPIASIGLRPLRRRWHPGLRRGRGPDEPSDVQGAALKKRCSGQPWRCLWRGFSQITMTRPWRRITLHLSQIFFTLGLTFIEKLSLRYELNVGDVELSLVAVDDATAAEVVRREFHHDPVLGEDSDVV